MPIIVIGLIIPAQNMIIICRYMKIKSGYMESNAKTCTLQLTIIIMQYYDKAQHCIYYLLLGQHQIIFEYVAILIYTDLPTIG